jgi:hypothetical protein
MDQFVVSLLFYLHSKIESPILIFLKIVDKKTHKQPCKSNDECKTSLNLKCLNNQCICDDYSIWLDKVCRKFNIFSLKNFTINFT